MSTNKKITTVAATFGTALTTLYAAPEVQAEVTDFEFAGSPVAFTTGTDPGSVDLGTANGSFQGTIFQNNNPAGKTALGSSVGVGFLGVVNYGQTLVASTFQPTGINAAFSADAEGIAYVGIFNPANLANADTADDIDRVGWFSLDLGGTGGDVTYLDGQFGSLGESVVVGGGTPVPEPAGGALAALAFGVIGLRRKRKN